MSNLISPFQIKRNSVVAYEIHQSETIQEYESASVSLGADYKISDINKENERLDARVDLFIVLLGKTNNDETVFEIKLNMMGIFEGNSEQISYEKFSDMLKINGLSTLMQLSRAYVTATTSLSGFSNPINFPMVNVFELIKWKESK